ncbi:alkaline phosphatase-like [Macrosteles quadrilineatus]|uniref:alkaline phosphatase-like n=1 Tax=Macrosteles quadrilineatus TaxID=74068 RepID=UPI0023E27EF5|nr:alkaline phosphatase-like [Macrosteles quadrilineatus]
MAQPALLQSRHAASQLTTAVMIATAALLLAVAAVVAGAPEHAQLDQFKYMTAVDDSNIHSTTTENDVAYWRAQAQDKLFAKMQQRPITSKAKNLILFLGDGMSITTVTSARIYHGQLDNQSGEGSSLSFEELPWTGLSRTYCVNKQVADSACSSTAYLGGVKANYGTLGVTAAVTRGNCSLSNDPSNHVDTILSWAQEAGKATGLVTTTRITHASPAGHYAHIADRDWESDYDMLTEKHKADPSMCQDIAYQLVHNLPGKNCKVLLGGGRSRFLPNNTNTPLGEGERKDGRNLVEDWKEEKKYRGKAAYVTDRNQLLGVDIKHTDYLLGLFQKEHLLYHLEENSELQPSLEEMTETAIKMLQKEKKGFYLFVEGGRIDFAHHDNMARRALDETNELHKAVKKALEMTSEEDTLVVVTADHSHTMMMAGYAKRGSNILGLSQKSDKDGLNYTTLSYANGPSAERNRTGPRRDVTNDDFDNPRYQYPSLVPLKSETHGGDDVAVFARGPWAHLLVGSYEQNVIPHVMAYAARIGPMASAPSPSAAPCMTSLGGFALMAVCLLRLLQ